MEAVGVMDVFAAGLEMANVSNAGERDEDGEGVLCLSPMISILG